jgi:hypothetical protein
MQADAAAAMQAMQAESAAMMKAMVQTVIPKKTPLDKYKENKAAIKIHFIYNIYKVIDPHHTL